MNRFNGHGAIIATDLKLNNAPYRQNYKLLLNTAAAETEIQCDGIQTPLDSEGNIIPPAHRTVDNHSNTTGCPVTIGDDYPVDVCNKDNQQNVRQKVKEILDFIQDDDRLRDERKKAKKNKDKYIGMSGEGGSIRGYSDRYDEEPRPHNSYNNSTGGSTASNSRRSKLDDIDDWHNGKKSVAEEAIGKVKDFINKARGFDEPPDYGNDDDLFDEDPSPGKKEYKDNDLEEYSSVERTHSYKTEKITTNRKSRTSRKIDLGASAGYGKDDSDTRSQSETSSGVNDFAVASKKQTAIDLLSDSQNEYQAANANSDFADFNPRESEAAGSANGDFGDFSNFKTGAKSSASTDDFADFTNVDTTSVLAPSAQSPTSGDFGDFSTLPAVPSQPSTPTSVSNADLLGNLTSGAAPLQPMKNMNPAQQPLGSAPIPQQPMGSLQGSAPIPQQPMGATTNIPQQPMVAPVMGFQPVMGQQPVMAGVPPMGAAPQMMGGMPAGQGMMPMNMNMQMRPQMVQQANNPLMSGAALGTAALTPTKSTVLQPMSHPSGSTTQASQGQINKATNQPAVVPQKWANAGVNINLDNLSPASKYQKSAAPSMNQLQSGQPMPGLMPAQPGPGMSGLSTNMAQMSVNPQANMGMQGAGVNQGMMGMQQGTIGMQQQSTMGMQQGMMGMQQGNMGMQSNMATMQQSSVMSASFQQRTNQAFSSLGTIGK